MRCITLATPTSKEDYISPPKLLRPKLFLRSQGVEEFFIRDSFTPELLGHEKVPVAPNNL